MVKNSWWRSAVTTAAAAAAMLVPAATGAAASVTPQLPSAATSTRAATLPEPPPVGVARTELSGLHVESPHSMNGYSRAKFPHWIKQYGECDTREVVLARDGQDVKEDEMCRAISGTWYSEYDGETLTESGRLDIDHVVPLANAWRSGADTWTTPKRKEFANDLVHSQLIAVSARSNRQKGDQSPDQWAPSRHGYWCTYARAWVDVKHVYHLNVTEPEKGKLNEMLDTCAQ
ncbi:HNH endonuclease family protein [Streptomyces sp. NPDC052101]|uniref:HNH endonuclease family protein n=1 Tax=Streptomyces sp. NPDC052101 TaxID=3155763 RepID=UPI003443619B